jgi:hypothetical protein
MVLTSIARSDNGTCSLMPSMIKVLTSVRCRAILGSTRIR